MAENFAQLNKQLNEFSEDLKKKYGYDSHSGAIGTGVGAVQGAIGLFIQGREKLYALMGAENPGTGSAGEAYETLGKMRDSIDIIIGSSNAQAHEIISDEMVKAINKLFDKIDDAINQKFGPRDKTKMQVVNTEPKVRNTEFEKLGIDNSKTPGSKSPVEGIAREISKNSGKSIGINEIPNNLESSNIGRSR